jgi:ribosomal protein S18 acetylase RimI-like enzyme
MEQRLFEVTRLLPEQVGPLHDQIVEVYRAAFTPPPYTRNDFDFSNFSNAFARHKDRPNFRCAVASTPAGAPSGGRIVGFAYGYTSSPGQWWHDLVEAALDPRAAREWLGHTFELVELAVDPRAQHQGAGGRLHDLLLEGLPHRAAILSTMQVETVALKLYRKRGWITLLENFLFPGSPRPYLIMGLRRELFPAPEAALAR